MVVNVLPHTVWRFYGSVCSALTVPEFVAYHLVLLGSSERFMNLLNTSC